MSWRQTDLSTGAARETETSRPGLLPDQVEGEHQAVRDPLAGPDDEHVQVHGDGHGPEEGAGVGEGGQGALHDALRRVLAENLPHTEGVGDGGEPVRHGEEDQQPPGSGA